MRHLSMALLLLLILSAGACHPRPTTTPAAPAGSAGQEKKPLANADVRHQIQSTYDTDPAFNDSALTVVVTNTTVSVYGYVMGRGDRVRALRLAESYAGGREVVDHVLEGGLPPKTRD